MDAFIFDFDGVIVDSERHWGPFLTALLSPVIPGFTREVEMQFKGRNMRDTYAILRDEWGLPWTEEDFRDRIDVRIDDVYGKDCVLLPGIPELLKSLRGAGIPIGIASSSRRPWIEKAIKRLGIDEFFVAMMTGDDVAHAKPDPEVFLKAAAALGAKPERCVAIEDSKNGALSAKAAGMVCIGLHTDMNHEQDLSMTDVIVEDLFVLDAETIKKMIA